MSVLSGLSGIRHFGAISLICALSACASAPQPTNLPISEPEPHNNLHRPKLSVGKDVGETLVMLSFSGGGTRAAALSYGVMQELRDTRVTSRGQRVRILDEIDTISSVSGGSFSNLNRPLAST